MFVIPTIFLLATVARPTDAVRVHAEIPAGALMVGQTHEMKITAEVADGWSSKKQPPLIVQFDYPACVAPTDKVLEGKALSGNEFISEPNEYMLKDGEREIQFRLISEPKDNDKIGINVIGYLRNDDESDTWFVRQRYELPVKADAKGARGDDAQSTWSEPDTLHIGEKMPPLKLPQADNEMIDIADYAKGKNLVITTYRAFW